ncbi:MAG: VCBS repeat-containing protein [Deinococcus sp.]|nr:VCBS repeat-containing protein [Deinococcus sp.]
MWGWWRVGVLLSLGCLGSATAQELDLAPFVPPQARQEAKVVQADLTGDGVPEVVVFYAAEQQGVVLVLSSSAQRELTRTEVDLAGASGFDLAPRDFDGDGAVELVVTGLFGDGHVTSYAFWRWDSGQLVAIPVLDEGANEVLVDSVATAGGPVVSFQDLSGDGAQDLVIDSLRVSGEVVVQIQDVYRFSRDGFLFQPELGLVTTNDLPIVLELAGIWQPHEGGPELVIGVLPDLTGYDLGLAGFAVSVVSGTTTLVPGQGRLTQLRLSDPAGQEGVLAYDTAAPKLLQISGFGDQRDGTYQRVPSK